MACFLHHPCPRPLNEASFPSRGASSPCHAPSSPRVRSREQKLPALPSKSFLLCPQCPLSLLPDLAAPPPPHCPGRGSPPACHCLLQDHLQQCLFQAVQCCNERCREPVLRKDLKEHASTYCQFREEKCLYCKKDVVVINLQVKKKEEEPSLQDCILPERPQ